MPDNTTASAPVQPSTPPAAASTSLGSKYVPKPKPTAMAVARIWLAKKWVMALLVVIAAGAGYEIYLAVQPKPLTRYVLSPVTTDTLIVSVSGSGQMSGQNEVSITPTVSGAITKVLVKSGDAVKQGQTLFQIDDSDAQKTVRDAQQSVHDAQLSLQSSELSLSKLKEPADPVQLQQDENQLSQAQRNLQKLQQGADPNDIAQAEADIQSAQSNVAISSDGVTPQVERNVYDSSVPTLISISQAFQQALSDADAIIGVDNSAANVNYAQDLSIMDPTQLTAAKSDYMATKLAVETFKTQVDALQPTNEPPANIDAALTQGQTTASALDTLLQQVYSALLNTLTSTTFSQSSLNSLESNIQGDRTSVSGKLATIVSEIQSIQNAQQQYQNDLQNVQKAQNALTKLEEPPDPKDVATAQDAVTAAQKTLDKLQQGADPIDLSTSENSVARSQSALVEAENKLNDAEQALSNYTIKAPFDGVIAGVKAQVADQASGALATELTQTQIAQITLNEVDAAKVQVGDKATLTFDAIPDLTMAGSVLEIDPLGTVSQGVVSYSIEIAAATQDSRIKPGMSVSASIDTEIDPDVLVVPNSALKTVNGSSFVQVLPGVTAAQAQAAGNAGIASKTAPQNKAVQIGSANDTETIITSGLSEGDLIVTRTIQPTAATAAAPAGSALRVGAGGAGGFGAGGGGFGGAGGAVRITTGGGGAAAGR